MSQQLLFAFLGLTLSCSILADDYVLVFDEQKIPVTTHFMIGDQQSESILRWLENAGVALAQVYGRWPHQQVLLKVAPLPLLDAGPVPWAKVERGHPEEVSFYISFSADEDELVRDWTAYHELSHLLIPYRGWGDLWFSEGLASYYQNILQRRIGLIGEEQFWTNLLEGFVRGRRDAEYAHQSLTEVSAELRDNHSYMRVYWSGAWYFLEADRRLREATNNRQSLDSALEQLAKCCSRNKWPARKIARRLDELTAQNLFAPLFDEVAGSYKMPEFESSFGQLGVLLQDDQVSSLGIGHANVELRQSIAAQTTQSRYTRAR